MIASLTLNYIGDVSFDVLSNKKGLRTPEFPVNALTGKPLLLGEYLEGFFRVDNLFYQLTVRRRTESLDFIFKVLRNNDTIQKTNGVDISKCISIFEYYTENKKLENIKIIKIRRN